MQQTDINLVINIVIDAAKQELLPRYNKVCHEHKTDGSIVTEADIAVQTEIIRKLLNAFPASLVLGEEMTAEQQASILNGSQPVWCLDPIDGTSNFAFGIPYFAISLALIENGQVVFGLVYDPVREECFSATENNAQINGLPIKLDMPKMELNKATAIVDFKRLTKKLATALVAETPFASQRNFGASALDWCWLAIQRGHVYLHGNQNIWDYIAGQFIFEQCGGFSQTLTGEKVFKLALEKRSVVAAIDENVFKQWTHWISQYCD